MPFCGGPEVPLSSGGQAQPIPGTLFDTFEPGPWALRNSSRPCGPVSPSRCLPGIGPGIVVLRLQIWSRTSAQAVLDLQAHDDGVACRHLGPPFERETPGQVGGPCVSVVEGQVDDHSGRYGTLLLVRPASLLTTFHRVRFVRARRSAVHRS